MQIMSYDSLLGVADNSIMQISDFLFLFCIK